MILIVTALHCEAKPLISRLGLKKLYKPGSFEIYSGDDILLAVGGTGIVHAAGVTGHLLALAPRLDDTVIINAGICGTCSEEFKTGTPILANKITNMTTRRSFYPDILFKHSVHEGTVASFTVPVSNPSESISANTFADMEAAGFFETASVFLPPNCIQCFKLVSDHLEGKKLEQSYVSEIMASGVDHLLDITYAVRNSASSAVNPITPNDSKLLDLLAGKLMFSETMKHQIKQLALRYAALHSGSLDCLNEFTGYRANSKKEGKLVFERIRKALE